MFRFMRQLEDLNRFGVPSYQMPRSRRRHHSRSRSRSRSHSHDRDREPKRRKVDSLDSPNHKRSVSCEPEIPSTTVEERETMEISNNDVTIDESNESTTEISKTDESQDNLDDSSTNTPQKEKTRKEEKLLITPKKTMSPKQIESEKKRQQKRLEREEREKKKQEERERVRLEKEKQKQEKEKQKQEKEELKKKKNEEKAKERELKEEQKRKEKEEKEAKRKEKQEREETKRKEREQDKLRKQQEIEEKNREKQKLEEQKQKTAQAFVNFFVPKKIETKVDEPKTRLFMPFQVKSDMRLAPLTRHVLSVEGKNNLDESLVKNDLDVLYLSELKQGRKTGTCGRTWPFEEDVIIVEEDFGESICEDKQKKKMRAKFLKFHENRRPAYYGTWRKKSCVVKPRRPFGEDRIFDYEVDSDDDWEEEEQGESLNGSDDEDKENEAENEDYEVDNEFFVPHGHLSDDEVDDEATAKLSPESHKQKLKLLKDEFDQDMQTKTNKIKPRSIGCIWYKRDGSNVDEAIDRHLRPLGIISNGQIVIKKRKDLVGLTPNRKYAKELREDLIPAFLKLIQGNVNKRKMIVDEFISYMQNNGYTVEVSKTYLGKRLKQFAQWKKCLEEGPMLNKFCWCLEDEVKKRYLE
ncbi:hypothetical protein TcasGA2_TC031939 [Tribolium castaneum]|uniref:Uncharacterized protein n=1 Tax=Tribolium castaneum TaxID=7070 RepID=A0A139WAW7_TRICA|nr:PREDICTED: chromatin assembly factor 1 subunit A isoform X3 [Tribolium castaneum]KYB25055.1 hypothetical protein TcasGA2_TC031939 [Tribolium castaneum]|eukprot:XP_015839469.1 PREDICTED: chromatin assembly factor 1 subunit A isoform X3 [Tribolium castaneum]